MKYLILLLLLASCAPPRQDSRTTCYRTPQECIPGTPKPGSTIIEVDTYNLSHEDVTVYWVK